MINIQRNYFVETILLEANIITQKHIFDLPYRDYIETSIDDELILIFFDLDRLNNCDAIKKDLEAFKKKENKIIFIPSSRNKKKLETFIQQVEKKKIFNLTIINLYKLNIEKIVDVKREKIYKSYLSFEIQIKLSNIIKNMINLLLNKDIRLITLDLDNTCWSGVIGEDGINKIFLDDYQKKSLNYINKLISKTGLIISFHSKNESKLANKGIIRKLSRYSLLVKKSFKYINWDPKLKSIKYITKLVNFSKKNIIYFDDNISEIKQLDNFLIKENCFWVQNSYIFYLYSKSIFISNIKKEKNLKRFKDIKSNIQRNEIAETKGILNYIKSSNVKINFTLKKVDLKRFIEMSNKTNQFNSNYQRLNIHKIKSYNRDKTSKIITFSVSDKYSDSGIIASIVINKIKETYLIIEFLISCRALGRGLEHVFINQIIKKFSIKNLKIAYIKTDRNEPFIKFAEQIKLKKNKANYFINLNKVYKIASKYEKFIKIKTN